MTALLVVTELQAGLSEEGKTPSLCRSKRPETCVANHTTWLCLLSKFLGMISSVPFMVSILSSHWDPMEYLQLSLNMRHGADTFWSSFFVSDFQDLSFFSTGSTLTYNLYLRSVTAIIFQTTVPSFCLLFLLNPFEGFLTEKFVGT